MKFKESQLYRLFADIIGISTSADKARTLVRVPLYSNALFLMSASVSSALFGFVFWLVVARFYAVEDVGLASATIAAMGFVVSLSKLGLEIGLVRFLHQTGEDANSTLNTVFTIGMVSSFTAALIFVAGLGLRSPALVFIRENPAYLAAFIVFTSASTLSVFTDHTYIAGRRANFTLVRVLIFSFMKLPLAIALAGLLHSFGIFSSWGISLVVALLISMFFFLPRAQSGYRFFFTVRKQVVKDMVRFAFANYVSAFLWGAPAVVFPIMVLNLLGAESNAYFYIAWAIGSVLTIVPNDVSTSLFAEGSYDETQLRSNIKRSLKMVFIILVPSVILVMLIADKLLLLFGGDYSQNATFLLRILALATLPLAINIIYMGIKRVQRDLKSILGLTTFVAVVALGLAFVLVPDVGIKGAGIAWLAGQSCAALVIIINWLRRWRKIV